MCTDMAEMRCKRHDRIYLKNINVVNIQCNAMVVVVHRDKELKHTDLNNINKMCKTMTMSSHFLD